MRPNTLAEGNASSPPKHQLPLLTCCSFSSARLCACCFMCVDVRTTGNSPQFTVKPPPFASHLAQTASTRNPDCSALYYRKTALFFPPNHSFTHTYCRKAAVALRLEISPYSLVVMEVHFKRLEGDVFITFHFHWMHIWSEPATVCNCSVNPPPDPTAAFKISRLLVVINARKNQYEEKSWICKSVFKTFSQHLF